MLRGRNNSGCSSTGIPTETVCDFASTGAARQSASASRTSAVTQNSARTGARRRPTPGAVAFVAMLFEFMVMLLL